MTCLIAVLPMTFYLNQATATAWCERLGAREHAEACATVGTQDSPGFIIMPTRESARWFRGPRWTQAEWDHALQHELQHAVCGLPAETH